MLLGSGELGREFAIAAKRLGCRVIACDRYAHAPAMQCSDASEVFSMLDGGALRAAVEKHRPDVIVPEIEAIDTATLADLEREGWHVVPSAKAVQLTMNRDGIRDFAAKELGLTTSRYLFVESRAQAVAAGEKVGFPCVVKPVMSSSGKGQSVASNPDELATAWDYAVANIRTLARAKGWDGAAIYRVQDNYVVQWGHNDDRSLPAGIVAKPPAEYDRATAGMKVTPFPYRDSYAPRAGFAGGWPVAVQGTRVNLTHCYGDVGVGRGLSPDTGTGGELYAVIGQAPRQRDRVIAIVGRVISGIEVMSSLPRGTEALGFYKERSSDVPIARARLAADMPAGERPAYEMMDTSSATFAAYVRKRANRRDDFYIRPAGGVDLCNVPVPVRGVN
jgi:peptidylprolyl isomerase